MKSYFGYIFFEHFNGDDSNPTDRYITSEPSLSMKSIHFDGTESEE